MITNCGLSILKLGSLIKHTPNKDSMKRHQYNACSNYSIYASSLYYYIPWNVQPCKMKRGINGFPSSILMAHKSHLSSKAGMLCLINSQRNHYYRIMTLCIYAWTRGIYSPGMPDPQGIQPHACSFLFIPCWVDQDRSPGFERSRRSMSRAHWKVNIFCGYNSISVIHKLVWFRSGVASFLHCSGIYAARVRRHRCAWHLASGGSFLSSMSTLLSELYYVHYHSIN